MSEVTLLPSAGRAQVPWKNGGGVTQTVASYPEEAGLDDFLWRVSIAEVQTAGPFSAFPETDRHLSVLEGTLLLEIAGQPPAALSATSGGLAFAGDVAAAGTPVGGAVLDLNVMTRRGRFGAEVERIQPGGSARVGAALAFLIATAATKVECSDIQISLERHDAVRIADLADEQLSIQARAAAHLIRIFPASRSAGPARR